MATATMLTPGRRAAVVSDLGLAMTQQLLRVQHLHLLQQQQLLQQQHRLQQVLRQRTLSL